MAAALRVPLRSVACLPAARSLNTVWRSAAARCPAGSLASGTGAPVALRCFSSPAASKVVKVLTSELKHEEEQYEQSKEIKNFLKNTPFKLAETDGDVNMALERDLGDKTVRIEWQLTSPFDPENDEGGDDDVHEATELSVTVEDKKTGAGMTFYCSTQTGEDHRYVIGNVKTFASAEEKDSVSSYHGPEFEDLDDKLQEAFDEYLAELGMSSEICDFVDAMAVDKEQREYVRWLRTAKKLLES